MDSTNAKFYISNANQAQTSFLKSYLLEVRVWKRALSYGTVLYNRHIQLNPRFAASLVLYFPLNENDSLSLRDISVYASITLTGTGFNWATYSDLTLCQTYLEKGSNYQTTQYIDGEDTPCSDTRYLLDLSSLTSTFFVVSSSIDKYLTNGIGYQFWVYQTSYAVEQSVFSHMSRGLKLTTKT